MNKSPSSPEASATTNRDRLGGAVAAIVRFVVRAPWLVVAASIAVTGALAFYAATNLRLNTDPMDMLSPELPFRRNFEEYQRAFPAASSNLVIVVEAEDADRAEDGADALYQRLAGDRGRFHAIFYPEGERFFRQNGLLYLSVRDLQALATRLAMAQPLLATLGRDPSLRGLFEVLGFALEALGTPDSQPQQLAPVLQRLSAVIEARNADRPRPLSWKELMGGEPVADDRRRFIVAQPDLNYASISPASEAIKEVRRHARELGLTPENGVRVRVTGFAAIETEEIQSVANNTELSSLLSFVAVALLLVFCFRSFWIVLSSLITLVIGLVWSIAFAVAAIGSLNLISAAVAVLFIGIGVDFSIHVALRYREMTERGFVGRAALIAAGFSIGTALALMAATAALGFFSFLPTDYRGVSELGLIAGFSMFVAFATNVTVLPALLALRPLRLARAPGEPRVRHRIEASEHWLWQHSRLIVGAAVVIGAVSLMLLSQARFDRNPLNLKDTGTESVATALELLKNPRLRVGAVSVVVDSLEAVPPLAAKLRALPSVGSVRSIYDFAPTDQTEKLDILEEISLQMTPILSPATRLGPPDAEQRVAAITAFRDKLRAVIDGSRAGPLAAELRRLLAALDAFVARGSDDLRTAALEQDLVGSLPKRLEVLKAALSAQPVDFASLPEILRQRELSPAGKVRIEISPKEDVRDNEALRRFVTEVQTVAPNATGGPVVELAAGDAVVHSFVVASIIAAALISLGLLLLLRNVYDLLLILAPLLLASALTTGIAVLAGMSFNFANIIVLPLLIGLGVSSGVHLVIRARRDSTIELLQTTTPRAVLFSALATIVAFASLAASSHWGQASMGLLLLIAMSVNLVCYLVVLPALLAYVEQQRLRRLVARRK